MWVPRKKFLELERKAADLEHENQNQQSQKVQYHGKTMELLFPINKIPTEGYVATTHILSAHTAIQFAVPSHEWSVLEKSREWKDFQALLEKIQEEFYQKKHQAVEA